MSEITKAVQKLYNTYPFPPDPLLDEPPTGYNWRWHYQSAYNFCVGKKPSRTKIRILDAGCGTGSGTEYLILHNPEAEIVAVDISENALATAQKRLEKSGVLANFRGSITFQQLPLESLHHLTGTFDFINCVGVLHHLPEPELGLKALADKLGDGGIIHIFVYGELGRWEIQLMQRAIALLQGEKKGDYVDGVKVGRDLFATLPETNPLVKREKERWQWENQRDECFADMYVHPQETDYNIDTLFQFINTSGLEFVGFSNPDVWHIERLIGKNPELLQRAKLLAPQQLYRLIELLDPSTVTHYEFFLAKPPFQRHSWHKDEILLQAIPELNPCLFGFPSTSLLDYQFKPVTISEEELEFMRYCEKNPEEALTVAHILHHFDFSLTGVRSLLQQQLIIA